MERQFPFLLRAHLEECVTGAGCMWRVGGYTENIPRWVAELAAAAAAVGAEEAWQGEEQVVEAVWGCKSAVEEQLEQLQLQLGYTQHIHLQPADRIRMTDNRIHSYTAGPSQLQRKKL